MGVARQEDAILTLRWGKDSMTRSRNSSSAPTSFCSSFVGGWKKKEMVRSCVMEKRWNLKMSKKVGYPQFHSEMGSY